ncbi:MAG TPA: hypothetical protein V6C69_18725 [Trichormus sp.]|jgi:hypothetical protein
MGGTKSDAGNLSAATAVGTPSAIEGAGARRDSLVDDFWKSYVDSGVFSPYNGFSQLVNASSHALGGNDLLSNAPQLAAPKESLGLGGKIAEYVGQAAGIATDVALLTLAVRSGASSFLREGATADSVSVFGRTMRPATLATAEATITGAAYQGVFQPSDGTNLLTDRLKGAAIGGASFGSLAWLGQAATPIITRFFVPPMRVAASTFEGAASTGVDTVAANAIENATATGVGDTAASGIDSTVAASAKPPLGVAYMDSNRVLNVRMRLESGTATGDIHLQYPRSHPQYKQIGQFLGNLRRDEGVPLTEWPFLPGGGVKS